jgi:hypothetical protein
MKKINLLMLGVLVLFAGFFSSCNKDTSAPGPSITFDNGATSGNASNGSYTINGTAKASGKLDKIQFYTVTTSNGSTNESEISGSAITSFNNDTVQHFSLTVNNITATTTIKVLVTDKNSVTASSTFTINAGSAPGLISTYSNLYMGGGSNTTYGSYLDAESGTVYKSSQLTTTIDATIDIIFDLGTLYNSDAGTFSSGTGTKFSTTTITTAAFDAMTDDSSISGLDGTANTVAVSANNVYFFKTVGGKKGLIKVKSLSSTTSSGTLNFDVKIQQ